MKTAKIIYGACITAMLSIGALTGCKSKSGADKYDKNGRLILELKNVYFEQWLGEDTYTEFLNEKFGVKITPTNYPYESWDESVNIAINGNNLLDTLHYNLKAYNFGSTYEQWVDGNIIKALPDDMSPWPNLQAMLNNVSNIDKLKYDGKLYCIPVMNDIVNYQKDFSNFTYVYRRDWAKQIDELNKDKVGYEPIYKEGDVYTWEEFGRLLDAFKKNIETVAGTDKAAALADQGWAFPSVTNFYKDVPHCFAKDSNGKAINAFTSSEYEAGLDVAKQMVTDKIYSPDQFNYEDNDNKAFDQYKGGFAGVLYDNFSLVNYIKLRDQMRKKVDNLEDATALMKVMGPDGKFALEGTENWFSATMFNYDISDKKMNKILDIMDYLLSEEGTRLAIYGLEGYDYNIVDGKVVLDPRGWEKGDDGKYAPKVNGAKYLRYMTTLGNDTKSFDPYTDMDSFNLLNAWSEEMKQAKNENKLRVVKEPADIDWMSTPIKNDKTETLLSDANVAATKYAYSKLSLADYEKTFTSNANWTKVLNEINEKLGK